jgi:hypothetical protein
MVRVIEVMPDPARMSVAEIEAELSALAPQLAEAYAIGSRATLLEARSCASGIEVQGSGGKRGWR